MLFRSKVDLEAEYAAGLYSVSERTQYVNLSKPVRCDALGIAYKLKQAYLASVQAGSPEL